MHFEVNPIHQSISRPKLPSLAFVVGVVPPAALDSLFKDNTSLDITATGTSFDVRANEKDRSIRATLARGKISVQRPGGKAQTLEPGYAYILEDTGAVHILPSDSLHGRDSWKNGEFFFENEPVITIMEELSRWYNVRITYQATFTDSFFVTGPRNQPINFLLDQMKATHRFTYKESHDTVYVSH